jgi:hypothetical protein
MPSFGQLVIGPPGSGKTTYCHGVAQLLEIVGRKVAIVNLDPANDLLPYQPAINVADLICLSDAMEEFDLGPNGGKTPTPPAPFFALFRRWHTSLFLQV